MKKEIKILSYILVGLFIAGIVSAVFIFDVQLPNKESFTATLEQEPENNQCPPCECPACPDQTEEIIELKRLLVNKQIALKDAYDAIDIYERGINDFLPKWEQARKEYEEVIEGCFDIVERHEEASKIAQTIINTCLSKGYSSPSYVPPYSPPDTTSHLDRLRESQALKQSLQDIADQLWRLNF